MSAGVVGRIGVCWKAIEIEWMRIGGAINMLILFRWIGIQSEVGADSSASLAHFKNAASLQKKAFIQV